MRNVQIAIIGAGPRGLAALERLSAHLSDAAPRARFDIHVIDPGLPGQGIHREDQADHLLTNTTAAQTTVFVDASVSGAGRSRPGPSHHDWLRLSGYRLVEGKPIRCEKGDEIGGDIYTSRALLGRYLHWAYRQFVARMPDHVRVCHHRTRAADIKRETGRFEIVLAGGALIDVDFVFITTGHGASGASEPEVVLEARVEAGRAHNPRLAYLRTLDAIDRLDTIPSAAEVAICGVGLTALDAVSMFTHGRGGIFVAAGPRAFRYVPSGREPMMTLFSRQGLPPASKAVDQRVAGYGYKPRFFTLDFVDRQRRDRGRLDWNADLLPCLKKEMAFRLAGFASDEPCDASSYEPSIAHVEAINRFLYPWKGNAIADPATHAAFVRHHLESDITESFVGNMTSPLKAVSETIRDLNDVVRHAVDYGGLTAASHESFLRDWCSINNRVAAGPPKERNMEILALIDAGLLSIFEPNPTLRFDESDARFELASNVFGYRRTKRFDAMIQARIGAFEPRTSTNPVIRSGLEAGLFSVFDNDGFSPSGLAVDRNLNVVGADGIADLDCWAMGYVVEGAHYYTYVLPCPSSNSRSLRDADKVVAAMMRRVAMLLDDDEPSNPVSALEPAFEREPLSSRTALL